jgi:hypothetical protein
LGPRRETGRGLSHGAQQPGEPILAINIVGKARDHLTAVISNGKLAQAELKEIAQVAERRRRFGIQ